MAKQRRRKEKIKQHIMPELEKENCDFMHEKEEKLLNLLAEIIVKSTLKEFYETCDQVSAL